MNNLEEAPDIKNSTPFKGIAMSKKKPDLKVSTRIGAIEAKAAASPSSSGNPFDNLVTPSLLSVRRGSRSNPDDPQQFDIVTALKDKRLTEVNQVYQDKFNEVVRLNETLTEKVNVLQKQLADCTAAKKIAEDAATTNFLLLKTETEKATHFSTNNMQLVKDLAADREAVSRLNKEKEKLLSDSKQKEAELAASFSSEYQRLTYAFEMMKSRYDSKKSLLEKKAEELSKVMGINFELERRIEEYEKREAHFGRPNAFPSDRDRKGAQQVTPLQHRSFNVDSFGGGDEDIFDNSLNYERKSGEKAPHSGYKDSGQRDEELQISIKDLMATVKEREETIEELLDGRHCADAACVCIIPIVCSLILIYIEYIYIYIILYSLIAYYLIIHRVLQITPS